MRVRPVARTLRIGAGLSVFMAALAAPVTPALAADMTHQLTVVWVPATAYGLALIAVYGKIFR